MNRPTTFIVNTPRLLVKYLDKLCGEVNENSFVLTDLKAKKQKELDVVVQKQKARAKAQTKAEAKARAEEDKFATARRIVAAAEAKVKAEEQAKIAAEREAEELKAAQKLLGKDNSNEE